MYEESINEVKLINSLENEEIFEEKRVSTYVIALSFPSILLNSQISVLDRFELELNSRYVHLIKR